MAVTNFFVMLTLLLGVCASLVSLNPGAAAYEDTAPFGNSAVRRWDINTAEVLVAGDAAHFFFGAHSLAAVRFRLYSYIIECVLLWWAISNTFIGLAVGYILYNQLLGLHTLISKVKHILDTAKMICLLHWTFVSAFISLLLALVALSARRSAIMFLCACGGLFVFGLGCLAFSYLNGEGLVLMHKAAQRNTWLSRPPLVSSTPQTGATLPRNEGSEDLFDGSLTSKLDEVPSPPRPRAHAYPALDACILISLQVANAVDKLTRSMSAPAAPAAPAVATPCPSPTKKVRRHKKSLSPEKSASSSRRATSSSSGAPSSSPSSASPSTR